ncbi:hypothetical protein EYC84_008597 [Monilinia fructicola]|uniref:Uncharacterized protein n=1 Tax=Monilinia fructicola TaxID=38448 RepID=A0A5M9JJS3_MONFR|nr:hypothetical protein EYC84_008597 [Monilinia fructicola]
MIHSLTLTLTYRIHIYIQVRATLFSIAGPRPTPTPPSSIIHLSHPTSKHHPNHSSFMSIVPFVSILLSPYPSRSFHHTQQKYILQKPSSSSSTIRLFFPDSNLNSTLNSNSFPSKPKEPIT